MKFIILDTETSDIRNAEIAQLTYLVFEDNNIKAFNKWFALDYMSPGASSVNGLTVENLKTLSNGQTFKDVAEEVLNDFKDAYVIAHNLDFDLPLLDLTIKKNSHFLQKLSYKNGFCTMEYYTPICAIENYYGYKWPKLSEVIDHLGITTEEILSACHFFFKTKEIDFHDARFDVAATYCILLYTIKNNQKMDSLRNITPNDFELFWRLDF